MRILVLIAMLLCWVLLAGCVSQDNLGDPALAGERVICRDDREIGSNLSRRVCKTASEWEAEREAHQEMMKTIPHGTREFPQPTGQATGGPGG